MRLAWKVLLVVVGVIFAFGLYVELQMHSDALPRYGKAGVGLVAMDTYVVTHGRQNIVKRGFWLHWIGASAGESQTTFIPPSLLIKFRRDRIEFFDFNTLRGGNYLRDVITLPAQVANILDTADQFVLLSLFPNQPSDQSPPPSMPWNELFHDYPILGKAEVRDKVERARLIQELNKSIQDSDGSQATCFMPRHGIHAALGDQTVDLVICFECQQVYAYSSSHPDAPDVFPITQSARPTFDEQVRASGLKLVK